MDGFAIVVRFDLKPGARPGFEALVRENARSSVRDEPGCRRFDVLSPRDGSDSVTLYEIYDDRTAFEAHLETAHFATFRDGTADMIVGRELGEFDLTENAAG